MSYASALRGYRGFGESMQLPCGQNSKRNPTTKNCMCLPGFDWVDKSNPDNMDCKPSVCGANEARSSIDKDCHCVPGFRADAANMCTETGLPRWFPECKDADGKSVSGCIAGFSPKAMAPWILGGAVVGLVLGAVVFR